MRSEIILFAALFAVILGASGRVDVGENVQYGAIGAGVGAIGGAIVGAPILAGVAVGAVGGVVWQEVDWSSFDQPIRLSLN